MLPTWVVANRSVWKMHQVYSCRLCESCGKTKWLSECFLLETCSPHVFSISEAQSLIWDGMVVEATTARQMATENSSLYVAPMLPSLLTSLGQNCPSPKLVLSRIWRDHGDGNWWKLMVTGCDHFFVIMSFSREDLPERWNLDLTLSIVIRAFRGIDKTGRSAPPW